MGDEAQTKVTLYGQEKDATTSGLARMNMILHDYPTALIKQGNKFNTINWRSYNEASGVPSLSASRIENIDFSCPLLPEQTAIATILSDMDAEITSLETKLNKDRQLKQGMMHNLLTGRIRLIE